MKNLQIRKATKVDAVNLFERLRDADVVELKAAGYPNRLAGLLSAFDLGGDIYSAVDKDEKVHAMYGIAESQDKDIGIPWLLVSNEFEQYKTMCVPKRLAIFLSDLLEQDSSQTYVDLPFNKTILAAHLGVQPGTLSRAFNQLTEYGVVSDRSSRIIFKDVELLQKYISTA